MNWIPLKSFCKAQKIGYAHILRLGNEGQFPLVRLGRRVFVDLDILDEFSRAGGQALPGGWRRNPRQGA